MKKRVLALALCLSMALSQPGAALALTQATPEQASAAESPPAQVAQQIVPATQQDFDVPCKAAVLMDEATGTILYEKNADEQRPIASITKVMTLLLAFEALESGKVKLTDSVPVSEHAYGMGGSQIWLEPGETFSLDEMLKAVCICSANDAAVAVAEFIGGSEPAFVERMNARAKELGMNNTHFCNACGLDEAGHLSSARDVAIMSREMLLHHPEVENYCMIWMDTLRGGTTQLVNTNKLLKSYSGITGLKTGTTGGAGVCISASAFREGLGLIAVVLGSASGKERFTAATTLLDHGFADYESVEISLPKDAPQQLAVTNGVLAHLALEYTAPGNYLTKKGQSSGIIATVNLPEKIEAPIEVGKEIGKVIISQDGVELAKYSIQAGNSVAKLSFGICFSRLLKALAMRPCNFEKEG